VNPDGAAQVVYAVADSSDGKTHGIWSRRAGMITGDRLHFDLSNRATVDYTMKADQTLFGTYRIGGTPSYVRLTRIPVADAAGTMMAAAQAVPRLWTEIHIPERSAVGETAGKRLMLEAMLYRTPLPGRRPLVIFNHGSTAGGKVSRALVPRFLDGAEPRVFLALGYNVIEPLRKGFGGTAAPMLEEAPGHYSQEVQLDSAVEDLEAVVEYTKTQPYVDPTCIIVAGQSRGGLLAVVYAGRYPSNVAGVINFSGGWWGEHMPTADFNRTQFAAAGRNAKVPMLWLYADHDTYYSLAYDERSFAEFRAQGGRGELVEVRDVPGNGHYLSLWPDRWEDAAASYLRAALLRR
jgi:pimeloyl-ACP methyl ester carboxylesterase